MFLRSKIRRKDGKEHRAWSVVENRRVHDGRVVQRQVLYLATQIFMTECGSPEPEARREAYRGTRDPGYINYTVGKLEILKLRDDYRAKMGDKFSLTDFHDRLLAGGLVPIKIIRREMMGADGPVL